MKKFRNIALLVACMLVSVLIYGCNNQSLTANFNERTIQIEMGQEYDPYSFIDTEIDANTRTHITFKSGNNQVAFVTPETKLVGVSSGSTALFCYYDNQQVAYSFVEVLDAKVQYDAPVNLSFNQETSCITWNYVYAQGTDGLVVASTYTVEITKNNGTPVEYQAIGNVYGPIVDFGNYKVRVKANGSGNFLSSDYSGYIYNSVSEYEYFEFNLMATPIDLDYDKATETFSWSANGNLEYTRYNVFVNNENITGVLGTSETSIVIPTSVAGSYSVYVQTVPLENYYFSKSKTLVLTQLASPELSFDNGVISWPAVISSKNYQIILSSNSTNYGEPIILNETSKDLSDIDVGEYIAEVNAIGDADEYIFDSESSSYVFEKIKTAELQFDVLTNTFLILNNSDYSCKIYLINQSTQEQTEIENYYYQWDRTDFNTYLVKAKFFATDATTQIDGDLSTNFVLNDEESTVLTKIQNLQKVNLNYIEQNDNSYIQFAELDQNSEYVLSLNDVETDLTPVDNVFSIGVTEEVFVNAGTYLFNLEINKAIQDSTFFIGNNSQVAVQKLPAPINLGLNGRAIEIKDADLNTSAIASTNIVVNNVVTSTLDLSASSWNILVHFVATASSTYLETIKTYFTSSNTTSFYITRLSTVQNISLNYETRILSWSSVSNASNYSIYIDGTKYTDTSDTQISYDLVGNKSIFIYANPAPWTSITTEQTGYYQSFVSDTYYVYQSYVMTNLTLQLNEGIVSANWVAPNNLTTLDLAYDVFVDDVAIITNLSSTTYTFDSALFEDPATYKISVKMTCPNNDFFLPNDNELSVNLTNLSAPTTLNKNNLNLSVAGFSSATMSGISINSTNYTQNLYSLQNMAYGEVLVLNVGYLGIFDSVHSNYNLNSELSTFTIQKLNTPQNLYYDTNAIYWETLDGAISSEFRFAYQFKINSNTTDIAYTTETTISNIYFNNDFSFDVWEEITSSWSSISADETKYLSNDVKTTINIIKEAEVSNLEMQLTAEDDIKILWNWTPIIEQTELDYRTNFVITLESSGSPSLSLTQTVADTLSENGKYYYIYEKSNFENPKTYTISVKAISNLTLDSNSDSITITKLGSVENVELSGTTASLVDSNSDALDLAGVSSVIVSGDTTAISGLNIDLSTMENGDVWSVNILLQAIQPQNVSDGIYYLNSETTNYRFVKFDGSTPQIDCENNLIIWNAISNSSSYSVRIEKPDGTFAYIEEITNNFISLTDPALLQITQQSGSYTICVKANVSSTIDLTPFIEANNLPIGYLGSDYADSIQINKLEDVSTPVISTEENDPTQTEVTITWNSLLNATNYDIYVSNTRGITGNVLATVIASVNPTVSYSTSTAFASTGTYFVSIVARGTNIINSNYSEQVKIVRLDSLTSGYINYKSTVSWTETTQIASQLFDYSYYLALSDLNDQFVESFGIVTTISTNYYSLSDCDWLNTLNGNIFKLNIKVLGNGTSAGASGVATLSSGDYLIEAYKFIAPTISVINSTINIASSDSETYPSNIKYIYSISSGEEIKVENAIFQSNFEIPTDWVENGYTVTAYTTIISDTQANYNLLESNITTSLIERLAQATNIVISATDLLDTQQKSVDISWNAVENATSYDIYINNTYKTTINSTGSETEFSFSTETFFAETGLYQVKILAKGTDYINSLFTEPISAVRLNPLTYGCMLETKTVNWTSVSQLNDSYTYYLQLLSESVNGYQTQGQSLTNITGLTYADFANNQWLIDFEGGNFAVGITVIGNGTSSSNGIATLSSSVYSFVVLKLYAPQITVNADHMLIDYTNGTLTMPGGGTVSDNSQNRLSIYYGENFAKDDLDLDINDIVYSQGNGFYYPDNWVAGVYTFKSYSKPQADILNVILSNVEQVSTTRLSATTELNFYREELTDTTYYSNDGNLNTEDYVSDQLYFSFTTVENCSSYVISNGSRTYTTTEYEILIANEFKTVIGVGAGTLKVVSKATGGDYINSAPSELAFTKLATVSSLTTESGQITWNLQENVSNYLIRVFDSTSIATRFWQSENGTISTSNLTGILDSFSSGQLAVNIKAIGNVPTSGIGSGTIILDSSYMENNTSFIKLETVDDLSVYFGYLTFEKVSYAENYVAKIYSSEDILLQSITLEDFAFNMKYIETSSTFVGYSTQLYGLEKETLYKIKIQVQSNATNTIYSDLSSSISFKILENANALSEDIGLTQNPSGDLTQTLITAYASTNSYGLLKWEAGLISVASQNETKYTERTRIVFSPVITYGGFDVTFTYASLGSSELEEGGFYYLSSTFTTSSNIHILDETTIWVEDGIIYWEEIEDADGYYVYIGGNLYQTGIYVNTFLNIGDLGFEDENTKINIRIVGVSNDLTYLYGPSSYYEFEYYLNNDPVTDRVNLYKNAKPVEFSIVDGTLVWDSGISNLNTFDYLAFGDYLNFVKQNPTKENLQALQTNLIDYFIHPVICYSEYTGFINAPIVLTFENTTTHVEYTVETTANKFLQLTELQHTNLILIKEMCLAFVNEILASLTPTTVKDLYADDDLILFDDNQYWYSYFTIFKNLFESNSLTNLIDLYDRDDIGWPNLETLFEELNTQTEDIPAGNYLLTVVQKGNDLDWLISLTTTEKSIYIPNAVNGLEIKEVDGDYLLFWNEVSIPTEYNYTPITNKYIIYGEDAFGSRIELVRTDGTAGTSQNSLYYNLSNLVNDDILQTDITKIFIVVAGDNSSVVAGLKSTSLMVTILPLVTPYITNGYLMWDSVISTYEYEIVATAQGYQDLKVITDELSWVGDESQLEVGVTYAMTIRPLGSIYSDLFGATNYVISGKKFEFNLSKLAPMNVEVNIYGVFVWQRVTNAEGFILDLENTQTRFIQNDGGVGTSFESTYYGYNNYLFRSLGSTSLIDSSGLFYLSSRVNDSEGGILGSTLSSVDSVWIENGVIKWTPLLNDNSNSVVGMTKVVGYRLTIDNGIGKIFTTDLDNEELFQDVEGNWCFDFTDYGTENNYNVSVQAFIYYENQTTTEKEIATIYIAEQDKDYYLLLGELIQIPFTKISHPSDLQIINGEIVWNGISSYSYVVEIYNVFDQLVYSEMVDTEKWWSDSPELSSSVYYKAQIKSYLDGCVYSVITSYNDILTGEAILFAKLDVLETTFDTDNNGESNIISFAFESQNFDVGFNIRYKTSLTGDYKYFDIYNSNYSQVISYLNNEVVITLNNLELDLLEMYFSIQIVPLGEEDYLKSNWSTEVYYSIPAPLEQIYYDSENFEYYWIDSTNGFIIKDEILNSENELIATYMYKIPAGDHSAENYFSIRVIDDEETNVLSYMPSVVGYNHRIVIAVCLDPFAEKTLLSPYCESDITTFNLFSIDSAKDMFLENSGLYLLTTQASIEQYIENNAFGTVANPYLINNSTDFANLNFRLVRYSYTYDYTVEYLTVEEEEITASISEENENYYFMQTQDLTDVSEFIGITKINIGGEIIYKGFSNTYDGQNYSITYNITASTTTGKLGLFNVLESSGIIKNLTLYANIDFNANINSSYVFGGIVGYNQGTISNITVASLVVSNWVDENNNGLIGITFGGIVGENAGGIINLCVLNNIELPIFVSSNGEYIYAGGIAGKNSGTIQNCGNDAHITTGKQPIIYVGGITGFNTGNILQCYNKGIVEEPVTMSNSASYLGGIAGFNSISGIIQNCYNVATVSGNTTITAITNRVLYYGGLVGRSDSVNIKNCFSTMSATTTSGYAYSGTLVGYLSVAIPTASATTQYNYYINDNAVGYIPISSNSVSNFATKLTSNDLLDYAIVLNATAEATIFKNGLDYPQFVWEP